jgi:hypothetical protein
MNRPTRRCFETGKPGSFRLYLGVMDELVTISSRKPIRSSLISLGQEVADFRIYEGCARRLWLRSWGRAGRETSDGL